MRVREHLQNRLLQQLLDKDNTVEITTRQYAKAQQRANRRAGVTVIALLNLFLFGILTAVFALRRGSIWGAAAMHTSWNLMQSNIFGISNPDTLGNDSVCHLQLAADRPLLAGDAYGLEGGLLVTFSLLLFIFLICVIPTVREHPRTDKTPRK